MSKAVHSPRNRVNSSEDETVTSTGNRPAYFGRSAALLVAASVLYCAPLFSNLDNWGREDWDQFTFRYETPRVAILRDHVLPTWNPYANGGTALLAHPDSPVLSPWYLIVLVLGGPLGLRVQVVVFMALGAVGMAAVLVRLGATRAGAVAGGIVFMMSSHFALHIAEGHLEWCVLGLMPWLALCVLRLREGIRHVILAALLLASVLTFGAVYIPAVYLPFFSAWILFDAMRTRQWRPLGRWGAVVLVAALLSSVKLLPTVEFTSDWPREVEPDLHQTSPGLLLAGLFDPRQPLMYQAGRDRDLQDGHFAKALASADAVPIIRSLDAMGARARFHEYGCYIGLAGILLAVCGGIRSSRRLWPLYVAGACAGVVVLGASSPVDLWWAMRHLPLYSQLQVPSRFLAAVVFVLSVAVAFGVSAVTDVLPGSLRRWRRPVEVLLIAVLYTELTLLGWRLFSDVFVIPPVTLEAHEDFAQRFAERSLYPLVMTSTSHAYLLSNSGTLDAYENLSVARSAVRGPDDRSYRGEAYLENGGGAARIRTWTMSSVTVLVEPDLPENLILNQNFYHGWRARRRDVRGQVEVITARPSEGGLISVPVDREHMEVELFYLPGGLVTGSWISGVTLLLCFVGLWFTKTPRGDQTQIPVSSRT